MSNHPEVIGPQVWWTYQDAAGVERQGVLVAVVDHGGTDISYHMRNDADGRLVIVSGSRIDSMVRHVL